MHRIAPDLFFAVAFTGEAFVAQSCESSANEGSYNEEPELRKSECVLREERLRDRTGRVNRGVGQRNRDEMDKGKCETNSQATESTVSMLGVGDTEDNHQEDECQNGFDSKSTNPIGMEVSCCEVCFAEEIAVAVSSERTNLHAGRLSNAEEDSGCRNSAEDLCTPIVKHLFSTHATVNEDTKADSRVEVGTADMTDTISGRYDGQTESECNA